MHGGLAQVISLIAHGSEWLASGKRDPPVLIPGNSAFRHEPGVSFEFHPSPPAAAVRAASVATWMRQLKDRGIERLWLVTRLPSGESWGILATAGDRQELWRKSTLRTTYIGVPTHGLTLERPALAATGEDLQKVLAVAGQFAAEHKLWMWADWFARAEALGSTESEPVPHVHPDMLPSHGYSGDARRLLAVATDSWVFGGMGWWGDRIFEDEAVGRERNRIGTALHHAMMRAFLASANSPLEPNP